MFGFLKFVAWQSWFFDHFCIVMRRKCFYLFLIWFSTKHFHLISINNQNTPKTRLHFCSPDWVICNIHTFINMYIYGLLCMFCYNICTIKTNGGGWLGGFVYVHGRLIINYLIRDDNIDKYMYWRWESEQTIYCYVHVYPYFVVQWIITNILQPKPPHQPSSISVHKICRILSAHRIHNHHHHRHCCVHNYTYNVICLRIDAT